MSTILLAACNDSTDPVVVRPNLPPLARSCVKTPLPAFTKNKPIPVFALENRRAAILNALAVGDCAKFYDEVRAAYGAN